MTPNDIIEKIRDSTAGLTWEGQITKLIEIRSWIDSQIEIAKLEIEWKKDASSPSRRGT